MLAFSLEGTGHPNEATSQEIALLNPRIIGMDC